MTGWDPWRDLFVASREIDQVISHGGSGGLGSQTAPAVYLPLDIRQTKDEFVLEASVAGFTPDEIEVVSDHGTLTIRGARKVETHSEGRYLRRERRQLSFFRQISLPAEVRESEISATFLNGVLSVRVPRVGAPAPIRIKVEAGSATPALDDAAPALAESAEATSPA